MPKSMLQFFENELGLIYFIAAGIKQLTHAIAGRLQLFYAHIPMLTPFYLIDFSFSNL